MAVSSSAQCEAAMFKDTLDATMKKGAVKSSRDINENLTWPRVNSSNDKEIMFMMTHVR